ncbi:MAG: hypothetical protein ACK4S4_03060 [Pyrinomonadaceae bacterium]
MNVHRFNLLRLTLISISVLLCLGVADTAAQDSCDIDSLQVRSSRFTENYAFPTDPEAKQNGAVAAKDLIRRFDAYGCILGRDAVPYLKAWLKRHSPGYSDSQTPSLASEVCGLNAAGTVAYINRLAMQSEGLWHYSPLVKRNLVQIEARFELRSDLQVRITLVRKSFTGEVTPDNCKDAGVVYQIYEFDPTEVESVNRAASDGKWGSLDIKLRGNTVNVDSWGQGYTVVNNRGCSGWGKIVGPNGQTWKAGAAWLPFRQSDPNNFERLQKAILHLRELAIDEYDDY